jgi:hypothetical protein
MPATNYEEGHEIRGAVPFVLQRDHTGKEING